MPWRALELFSQRCFRGWGCGGWLDASPLHSSSLPNQTNVQQQGQENKIMPSLYLHFSYKSNQKTKLEYLSTYYNHFHKDITTKKWIIAMKRAGRRNLICSSKCPLLLDLYIEIFISRQGHTWAVIGVVFCYLYMS